MKMVTVELIGRQRSNNIHKKYNLFHVSPFNLPKLKTMIPRIPQNYLTRQGYEDKYIRRISFAPSIGKCLAALAKGIEGTLYYVYGIKTKYEIVKPTIEQVPDVKITNEHWKISSSNPEYIGVVLVTNYKPESQDYINYTNRNLLPYHEALHLNTFDSKSQHRKYNLGQDTKELADWNWMWTSFDKKHIEANFIFSLQKNIKYNKNKNKETLIYKVTEFLKSENLNKNTSNRITITLVIKNSVLGVILKDNNFVFGKIGDTKAGNKLVFPVNVLYKYDNYPDRIKRK